MEQDYVEKMLKLYSLNAKITFGADAVTVLSAGQPGEYENNPTIKEHKGKGYKLCDANMFGMGEECCEVFTFKKKRE